MKVSSVLVASIISFRRTDEANLYRGCKSQSTSPQRSCLTTVVLSHQPFLLRLRAFVLQVEQMLRPQQSHAADKLLESIVVLKCNLQHTVLRVLT